MHNMVYRVVQVHRDRYLVRNEEKELYCTLTGSIRYREEFPVVGDDVEITETSIELGYVIHPAHHNCGFATEALQACIQALHTMGFETVRTGAFEENPASIRVMEKSGMTRLAETEIIPYRGKDHLCVYFEKRKNA